MIDWGRLLTGRPFLLGEQTLHGTVTNTGQTLNPVVALTSVSNCFIGSPGRIRTADQRINSPSLYH
jgi:hypothetical protein